MSLGCATRHCTPLTACSHAPAVILLQRCERFVRNVSHEEILARCERKRRCPWSRAPAQQALRRRLPGSRFVSPHIKTAKIPQRWRPCRLREKEGEANEGQQKNRCRGVFSSPRRIDPQPHSRHAARCLAGCQPRIDGRGQRAGTRAAPAADQLAEPGHSRQRARAGDDPHGSAAAGAAGRQRFRPAGQCGASAARGQVARAGGA